MKGTAKIKSYSLKSVLFQWETVIFVIFITINVTNINLFSNYLNFNNVMNNMVVFTDKVPMVFTIMIVLLLGEIDIPIASIVCLSRCCIGVVSEMGLPIVPTMMAGPLVGAVCGFSNGILLVAFPDLDPTTTTLGNQISFRGIAHMTLEGKPVTSISSKMLFLVRNRAAGVPLILTVFLIETLVSAFVIHRTRLGRFLYAIGSDAKVSKFSGIKTNWIKVLVSILSGLCVSSVGPFLISKLGSVRASIAGGHEVEVIAVTILGGVSTAGEKGKVPGAVPGVFSIGLLRYGPGIANALSQIPTIIIGALLVAAVTALNLEKMISEPASGGRIRLRATHNK